MKHEDLLDTIRMQQQDLDFYKSVLSMVMKEDQLYKIKAKSSFDDDNQTWKIPAFILKKGDVNLPKLKDAHAKQLVKQNLDQVLQFEDDFQSA